MVKSLLTLVLLMKNEAKSVQRLIESVANAVDSVDLLDTGSTDGTIRIARETCAKLKIPIRVYEEPFVDYATSRNRALEYAAPHSTFALQLSGDEHVVGAEYIRRLCESKVNSAGTGDHCFCLVVDYGTFIDKSFRIVRLGSPWKWVGETHEVMTCENDHVSVVVPSDQCRVIHNLGDPKVRRTRQYLDLKILAEKHREDPENSRTVFYLARTLSCLGFHAEAIRFYLARAEMPGWEEEKYVSLYQAGRCAQTIKRPWPEVQEYLLRATAMRPTRAEALVALAEYTYERKEYALTFLYATRAASIAFPVNDGLNVHKEVYDWRALNLVHLAGFHTGELDVGLGATRLLCERFPDEPGFQKNLSFYQALIEARSGKPLDIKALGLPE